MSWSNTTSNSIDLIKVFGNLGCSSSIIAKLLQLTFRYIFNIYLKFAYFMALKARKSKPAQHDVNFFTMNVLL